MLGNTRRDGWFEFMWAAIAGTVGSLPAAARDLYAAYWTKTAALGAFELVEVLIVTVFFCLAIIAVVIVRTRGMSAKTLIADIKNSGAD